MMRKIPIFLYALDELPLVAHPLVAEGRWLDPANPDEIVLDYSLAKFYNLQVGDRSPCWGRTATAHFEGGWPGGDGALVPLQ